MTTIEATTSEHTRPTMTTHDRNLLALRLLLSCAALFGPLLLVLALIAFAIVRGEQTRPWSHRSVASISSSAVTSSC